MSSAGSSPKLAGSVEVGDPDEILDLTAWNEHPPRVAESCFLTVDLGAVLSWFPRPRVEQDDDESGLRQQVVSVLGERQA